MKKLLCILLVVTLLVSPIYTVFAELTAGTLFDKFINSAMGKKIQSSLVNINENILEVFNSNDAKDSLNSLADNAADNIFERYPDIAGKLTENYSLSPQFLKHLNDFSLTVLFDDLKAAGVSVLISDIKSGELSVSTEEKLDQVIAHFRHNQNIIDIKENVIPNVFADPTQKSAYFMEVLDVIKDNITIKEKSNLKEVTININSQSKFTNDLKDLEDLYINDQYHIFNAEDSKAFLAYITKEAEKQINVIISHSNAKLKPIFETVIMLLGIKYDKYVPSKPSPIGGGGPVSTPTPTSKPSETEVNYTEETTVDPEGQESENLTANVKYKDLEVKDNTISLELKESDLKNTIEELLKTKKEGQQGIINIDLSEYNAKNSEVKILNSLAKSLSEQKIDITLTIGTTQFAIPSGVLSEYSKDITLSTKALETKETESRISKTDKYAAVKSAIEFKLSNSGSAADKFKENILVKINCKGMGDPDKLYLYMEDLSTGEIIPLTGKIKDNIINAEVGASANLILAERNIKFGDVKDSRWSNKYIESMASKFMIDGYEDKTFRPTEPITRAEFTKLAVVLMGLGLGEYSDEFVDVDNKDWFAPYISAATGAEIIMGDEMGNFNPEAPITRAQMAAILGRMISGGTGDIESLKDFKDFVNIPSWATEDVAVAVKEGMIQGFEDNTLRLETSVTREQAATVIYRFFNR